MSASMIKQQMMQLLRQKNIRCTDLNDIAIEAYMPGKEMETVKCIIAFGVDQLSIVDVKCQNLFNFKKNRSTDCWPAVRPIKQVHWRDFIWMNRVMLWRRCSRSTAVPSHSVMHFS